MNKSILASVSLAALIIAVSISVVLASDNLTVYFWDVRQGDSELIQFHNKNVLIDAGTEDMGPRVECYLKGIGISNLDLVVATHPPTLGPHRRTLDSAQRLSHETSAR